MTNTVAFDDTEVSGKIGVLLDAPMSPLLEESPERKLFAEFFSSTWIDESPASETFAEFFFSTSTEHFPLEAHARFAELGTAEWSTPLHTDRLARHPKRPLYRGEQPDVDPLTKATEDRVQLLARKYVAKDKFSDEESARLAIVTERVRKLLPAVTTQEFEALEQVLTSLRDISKANANLRDRLRLARQENA
jgi:hypothetical protein